MNIHLKRNLPPGSAIYTGDHKIDTTITHVIYNPDELKLSEDLEASPNYNHWFMVKGLKDSEKIKAICEKNQVDPLIIEDILNVTQRNKIEYYENYAFGVFSYVYLVNDEIKHDYLSVLLFKDKIFTFHEHNTYLFDQIYERLQANKGYIRKGKVDYLFYVVLDTIVDNFMLVDSLLSERILRLEEETITTDSTDQNVFYGLRKELIFIKKTLDPMNDSFVRGEYKSSALIGKDINKYFLDVIDHLKRVVEDTNTEREMLRNLLDVHMNNVSNRMNEIMKTLTIFSAIFIPMSFLAGVYGMNFKNFPILDNAFGLGIFIITCLIIGVGMIIFFKSRKWF